MKFHSETWDYIVRHNTNKGGKSLRVKAGQKEVKNAILQLWRSLHTRQNDSICDASQIWYRNFPVDLCMTRRGSSTAIFRLTCMRRVAVLVPQFAGVFFSLFPTYRHHRQLLHSAFPLSCLLTGASFSLNLFLNMSRGIS